MNKKFIINTITNWNEPPRARHQVAYALAKKHQVVFISANQIGIPRLEKKKISDNLYVIFPYFWIDSRIRLRIPFINRVYQKWLFSKLRKIYPKFHVINFDFTAKYLSNYFDNTVYYCNDDHIGMSYKFRLRWIADYHNKCEKEIIIHSKLCIATSSFLVEKLKRLNPNSFEIRLGAPEIKKDLIRLNDQKTKSDLINVGFVGFFKTIEFEIITSLISKKDLHLTIVGPMNKKIMNKIMKYNNVKITGNLVGQQLYHEISKFDVGLIPYIFNSEIDRTPNKLWLYLSLGKPTVISNIKSIIDWKFPDKFMYRANDIDDFYRNIRTAYIEDNDTLKDQRTKFAEKNTWDKRMEDFINLYKTTIGEP